MRLASAVLLLALSVAPVRTAETGTISGTLTDAKGVTAVVAVDRSEDKDRRFKGTFDPKSSRFTLAGLPLGATYDVIVDVGAARLEGVNLKVPPSDYEEEQPLTKADVEAIRKICRALNKFENEVDVLTVAGNCQHAAAVLNKRRTTPFYDSKPGEVIWRLELWHFDKPDDDWIKSQEYLGILHYRERLQKTVFAAKSLTLDPKLGGVQLTTKVPTVDLGRVVPPDGKPGITLRK